MSPSKKSLRATDDINNFSVVIVLYYPTDEDVAYISRMVDWKMHLVVVINAIDGFQIKKLPAGDTATVIINSSNFGLARGLNQGIDAAFGRGAEYVLMLDQDSRPDFDVFDRLFEAALRIESEGRALACVAPVLCDRKALQNPPFGSSVRDIPVAATFATSGTMITRRAWKDVGPMWELLFIDGIDHEWCFRARARGLETVLVTDAVMIHDMGEIAVSVGGRFRPLHRSPFRHYFIVRNTLWLARKSYIPLGWRIRELLKLTYRIPVYVLISCGKIRTIRYITAAIVDGVFQTNERQPL